MKGIVRHTREDRRRVIEEMTPLIQKKFGGNLVALAVTASMARGDDGPYSDLELTAFLHEMPADEPGKGRGWIRDGMLVELVWTTREIYLRDIKDVTRIWYMAGSDVLEPILNAPFIVELSAWRPANLQAECLRVAKSYWGEVQESTAKVLNAVEAGNRDGAGLLAWQMLLDMLKVLSYLNATPYVTFARFITQARGFAVKPAAFDELSDVMSRGEFLDLPRLGRLAETVFEQFEEIFEARGVEFYDDNVDPNSPRTD